MPKGPQGQKRPADAIGLAVMVGKIATGEIENDADESKANHREGAKVGGEARAAALSPAVRTDIAKKAARARWSGVKAARAKKELQEP